MTARPRRIVRLEDLVGRRVRTAEGAVVGRIEEVHAERRGDDHEVIEYLIGPGALRERFALVGRLFGPSPTLWAWLREYQLDDVVSDVTDRKPAAHVFIDDRAVCFRGDFEETLRQVDAFAAHWEQPS